MPFPINNNNINKHIIITIIQIIKAYLETNWAVRWRQLLILEFVCLYMNNNCTSF